MDFDPRNKIVQLCVQGIAMEGQGRSEHAINIFLQAWNEATNDFEQFIAAHFVARQQKNVKDKLQWLETALQHALKVNNSSVMSAFAGLYENIAKCYEDMGEIGYARMNNELALSYKDKLWDNGPFYHGTRADLKIGDLLKAGGASNYDPKVTMNHIYFTAAANGAGLAAALAKGDGRERVYIVKPKGSFENDPNVTDKKFPGNPTRSYRSREPLEIVGELTEWARQTPEDIQKWREKLGSSSREIIN